MQKSQVDGRSTGSCREIWSHQGGLSAALFAVLATAIAPFHRRQVNYPARHADQQQRRQHRQHIQRRKTKRGKTERIKGHCKNRES